MVVLRKRKKIKELKNKISSLEQKIDDLKEEKESYKNRYKSSEEKRKKLASQKQEREKELNKLQNRLDSIKSQQDKNKEEQEKTEKSGDFAKKGFNETLRILNKIKQQRSDKKELISIYTKKGLKDLDDKKALKNSLDKQIYQELPKESNFISFTDSEIINIVLKTRNLHKDGWSLGKSFDVEELLEFISREKYWVLVSSGDTRIVKEEGGDTELVKRFSSRVDRQHGKGGFSQDRFERKREEQIKNHLEEVEEYLDSIDSDQVFVLSDRNFERFFNDFANLGGFEHDGKLVDSIYNFRLKTVNPF